jgi:hypothetical protein
MLLVCYKNGIGTRRKIVDRYGGGFLTIKFEPGPILKAKTGESVLVH